MKISASLTIGW